MQQNETHRRPRIAGDVLLRSGGKKCLMHLFAQVVDEGLKRALLLQVFLQKLPGIICQPGSVVSLILKLLLFAQPGSAVNYEGTMGIFTECVFICAMCGSS